MSDTSDQTQQENEEYERLRRTDSNDTAPADDSDQTPQVPTHDYPTKKVVGRDLDNTMTLVGESGGLSSIYEAEPSNIAFGMLNITTEHGPLFLDPDEEYEVLDA